MPSVLAEMDKEGTVEAHKSRYTTGMKPSHEVKRIEWRVGRISEHIAAVSGPLQWGIGLIGVAGALQPVPAGRKRHVDTRSLVSE